MLHSSTAPSPETFIIGQLLFMPLLLLLYNCFTVVVVVVVVVVVFVVIVCDVWVRSAVGLCPHPPSGSTGAELSVNW